MNQTMLQGRLAIFRINYKSDFIITLNSDAGWMTPFCIKFWTGTPSQAYFAGWDGTTYTNCTPVAGEPTKLQVQFDDHNLPIGELKYQIGYHFTVADFPTTVEDEVLNQERVVISHDGQDEKVLLDFNGETAPDIQFSLPAYANEAQRIANEEQRIAHEAIRIVNEEGRIAAEQTRQQNEEQRIAQETARVQEFARLKHESESATSDATAAATLANTKAQLAADKAALAQSAADLANAKAQLAADKAALAASAAQLANDKAVLAQQKAEYAQTQGTYAKNQGDYAKQQGDYAKDQGDTALADHLRAEADHETAASDHTRAESDHSTASSDHTQASTDHSTATSDHSTAAADHTQAGNDHTRAESDHSTAASDHTTAGNDHTRAESDHTRAESDHAAVEVYVDSLGAYDISAAHAVGGVLATYANLQAALGTNGANIPEGIRKGGMSVKFIQGSAQSSDNKYVQFRCMSDEFTTDVTQWQGVDDEPTAGSDNLVKSDGVVLFGSSYLGLKQIGFQEIEFTDNQCYYYDAPTTIVESNVWRSAVINVKAGDQAVLNVTGGQAPRCWMVINSSNMVIASGNINAKISELVTIPRYGVKLIINDKKTGLKSFFGGNLARFDSDISTDYIDTLFNEGLYRAGAGILIIRKYSDSDIRQALFGFEQRNGWNPKYRKYNGSTWSDWEYVPYLLRDKIFKKGDLTTENLNTLFESGTYKYGSGTIVIVTNYSSTNIRQISITPITAGGMRILWRTYNGSSWSDWVDYVDINRIGNLEKCIQLVSSDNSATTGKIFVRNIQDGQGLAKTYTFVCKWSASVIRQFEILISSKIVLRQRESKDNGITWGDWEERAASYPNQTLNANSNGLMKLDNMPNITPISDAFKALSSGECNFLHEVSTGLVYVTAIEGFDDVYEASDCIALYVFSLTNPNNVKRFQIAEKLSSTKKCYTANILQIDTKKVRVLYSFRNEDVTDGGYLYYRDFDFETETLTAQAKVKLNNADVKATDIRDYTISKNYSGYGAQFVYIQKITEEMSDGYKYATCSCSESTSFNATIVRSNDNFETIELFDVVPYLTRYDCAVAGMGTKLYFVHRVAGDEYAETSGSALFVGEIGSNGMENWSADTKFAEGDSRTDCYYYKNKIYLMAGNLHSEQGVPKRVSSSVWEGTTSNPSDYTKVLEVNDTRGVQNPRVFRYGAGDYGVLMQNSPARIDYENGQTSQWQFKTAVCFVHTRIN